MALTANSFAKCAPSLSTNIKQCGSVTICNAKPLTEDELTDVYMKSTDYRVMEALFHHDFEMKQCEANQNGLYEFLMANKVNVQKRVRSARQNSGLIEIAPFIMARQYSPINNEYWLVSAGQANGNYWQVDVASSTNIPADIRSFPPDMRVYIHGKSEGGSATKTAWKIVSRALVGDVVRIQLEDQNSASQLSADKVGSPVTGLMVRGTPNVNDFEKWCEEAPAYLNWKNVPFWVESTRTAMCKSSLYDQWRSLLLEDNMLYREFGDLDDIAKNRQLANDWQKRLVNSFFWNKALPNQTMGDYDSLDDIETYGDGADLGLGVDGSACIGKRANAVGIYEQLAECNRVVDLLGGQLNLPALFKAIYNIMRVREANGQPFESIDIFTDSVTAELFNQAMIKYYNSKSDNTLRLTKSVDRVIKTAQFGFKYESYDLFWPRVRINIVTHYFFDDFLTAAAAASMEDTARVLWILDFSGIYPGILASNRAVYKTGDLKTLASVNPDFACVLKVPTREQTLVSLTYTVIVECPASNLIIENFDSSVPEHETLEGEYPSTTSTTTTTTAAT